MSDLDHQIVVRIDRALRLALEADAEAHGRTVAQSVRFHLRHLATAAATPPRASWIDEAKQSAREGVEALGPEVADAARRSGVKAGRV